MTPDEPKPKKKLTKAARLEKLRLLEEFVNEKYSSVYVYLRIEIKHGGVRYCPSSVVL